MVGDLPSTCAAIALRSKNMQITKSSIQTIRGSSEWFTGSVYVDTIAAPIGPPA
jgi:hypothetical protein